MSPPSRDESVSDVSPQAKFVSLDRLLHEAHVADSLEDFLFFVLFCSEWSGSGSSLVSAEFDW